MQFSTRAFDVKDGPTVVDIFKASWPGYPTTSMDRLCKRVCFS